MAWRRHFPYRIPNQFLIFLGVKNFAPNFPWRFPFLGELDLTMSKVVGRFWVAQIGFRVKLVQTSSKLHNQSQGLTLRNSLGIFCLSFLWVYIAIQATQHVPPRKIPPPLYFLSFGTSSGICPHIPIHHITILQHTCIDVEVRIMASLLKVAIISKDIQNAINKHIQNNYTCNIHVTLYIEDVILTKHKVFKTMT